MKITVDRALLEQAVEVLDAGHQFGSNQELVDALRSALAAPPISPWRSMMLGEYVLAMHNGTLTITHESGEGGEFDAKKFEAHVAKFFNKEF